MDFDECKTRLTNATQRQLSAHRATIRFLSWSCDGKRLASSSDDQSVRVWSIDAHREAKEAELKEHTGTVEQAQWQPGNTNVLATASADKSSRIWDIRTKKATLIQTKEDNLFVAWHKNGNYLALGDKVDLVSIYDVRMPALVCSKGFREKCWINEGLWWRDSDVLLLAAGESKQNHGCDLARGSLEIAAVDINAKAIQMKGSLTGHSAQCLCVRTDLQEKYLATGGWDGVVSLWDTDELACVHSFVSIEEEVNTVAFSGDGSILCAPARNRIEMWHVETKQLLPKRACTQQPVSVAWHPNQPLLAYGTEDTRTARDATVSINFLSL